jgi:hypothetical protein
VTDSTAESRLRNEALLNEGEPMANDILAVLALVEQLREALRVATQPVADPHPSTADPAT